jgi:hypothetical protein
MTYSTSFWYCPNTSGSTSRPDFRRSRRTFYAMCFISMVLSSPPAEKETVSATFSSR